MKRIALAVLLSAGTAAPAAAAGAEDCDGPTPVLTKCVWDAYAAADRELNSAWKEVLASVRESDHLPAEAAADWRDGLIAAQRAWARFKQADCERAVAYEWYGGTGANAAVGACLERHTRERLDDLRARYLAQ